MKVVIAGNYRQFMDWCRKTETSPNSVIYADTDEKLMGLELAESDIVRTGTYWQSAIDPALLQSRIRK